MCLLVSELWRIAKVFRGPRGSSASPVMLPSGLIALWFQVLVQLVQQEGRPCITKQQQWYGTMGKMLVSL